MNFIKSIVLFIAFQGIQSSFAQSGCTDPAATNFNPGATINDGSCTYPVTHKSPVLRGAMNPIITESSGLVLTDGKLWTHNDSGNPAEIYSIDTTDGHTLQTVVIDNYPNVDWEDITADSNYIYIGDHGNNSSDRTDLKVLKIAKTDIGSAATVHVNAQAISFRYTDQTVFGSGGTNNYDCEALISIKDSLYIFTKDRGDLKTRVYKMPKTPGTYALDPYTSYNVNGLITGADYNAHTHEIVLIGYFSGHSNSFLWYLSNYQGDMFFSGNKRRIEIGNGLEWQTEGVCWLSDNRVFISCETTDPIPASLFVSDINFNTTQVKAGNIQPESSIYPNPANDRIFVDNLDCYNNYFVTDLNGRKLLEGSLEQGDQFVGVTILVPGTYILNINGAEGNNKHLLFEKR